MKKPKLAIDILTLFPGMFDGPFAESLIGRAKESGTIGIRIHDLRKWSDDPRHQKVDDRPYGGGAGMVIRAEPLYRALKDLGVMKSRAKPWVVFLSPQGETLSQKSAERLASRKRIVLVCGHYEGIDERVMEWVDQELSIGDYVLTGGELPAMVVTDTVARLVPGVVGDPMSLERDSFSSGILDYPHYTRPNPWRGRDVPAVLLSGNHAEIEKWRRQEAVRRTKAKRPDLLKKAVKKQI